ncbi:hypothetical protein [Staphylothermus hellenicus]|uniref:Uncharacterized protein n=1 Tax=Staphylothermus hellenicus (strain DSM 12710 / JCM 10830 / BK20S6-10-b1 / P8) TaxID=591019 RepID=D7D7Y9_STAHD|nr:hypothetical protein [Staphylothermus hellenicus]ADI31885.1 hypothetical protein Shell_0769 [Staphylothermus hellenicus DSM 12710]
MAINKSSFLKNSGEVKKILSKAIELYNKFRAPEAKATLLEINGDKVKILFEGSFCFTCGVRDWVEDMVYVLEDLGVEAELVEYLEPDKETENIRVGVFRIKGYKEGVSQSD